MASTNEPVSKAQDSTGGPVDEIEGSGFTRSVLHQRNRDLMQRYLQARWMVENSGDADIGERERLRTRMQQAGDDLVAANVGIVGALSRSFKMNGLDEDLDQAGLVGLWEAIVGSNNTEAAVQVRGDGTLYLPGGWDPDRATLATAARAHVSGRLKRAVAANERRWQGSSYAVFTTAPKVLAAVATLRERGVLSPTREQIADQAGTTVSVVRQVLAAPPTSMDTPVGDGRTTVGDIVADTTDDGDVDDDTMLARLLDEADVDVVDASLFAIRYGLTGRDSVPVTRAAALVGIGRGTANVSLRRTMNRIKHQAGSHP